MQPSQFYVYLLDADGEMIDSAYDKTFVRLRYPEFSNRLRSPYIGLSDEESRICRDVLEREFVDVP